MFSKSSLPPKAWKRLHTALFGIINLGHTEILFIILYCVHAYHMKVYFTLGILKAQNYCKLDYEPYCANGELRQTVW